MGYDPNDFDVAKTPTPPGKAHTPGNCTYGDECIYCWGNGPSGTSTIVAQNNEKGILETGLAMVIKMHTQADLGSMHDGMRQGIYATNSVGDND